ncbi:MULTISPECIES: MFS transporter [unclassified Nostoc]|uniref:MFS transporter n=1 Tax=unclassified Nostoc TaxID=2593658 RepID=UPI002AD34594|nr:MULTISPECIES: MFS transporter [unclassified Nostoc]MDZ8126305.1 MFS transporter [Nostoc sp. CmiVER01]MDZ8225129.1 MFS transporter [Nostoc sp. ChiVER01]
MNSAVEITGGKSRKPVYLDKNLLIIFGITLMGVLGVSSINPVFPKIAKELNVSPQEIGLLITVFTFPSIVLTPILGVLADRFGRKKILVPSLMLFGIAGVGCGFAHDFNLLLVLRFLQGIGAASLNSLNVTLIGDIYSGKERTNAMGYNASVGSIGTASYPTIGGAIAVLGWHYPFMLPVLAIPIGLLVLFSLKSPEPKSQQKFTEYLRNALGNFKNRQFVGLFVSTVATFMLLYGAYITYIPILISNSFNVSALIIGIILSSMSATITLTSSQFGRLARKFSKRDLIKISFLLFAVALVIVPLIHSLWLLLIPTMIFGLGLGIGFPSIQTLLAELTPREYLAAVMSINGTFLGFGQTLGPLLMGAVFGIWGISSVFYAGAIFAIATFLIFRRCNCMESTTPT